MQSALTLPARGRWETRVVECWFQTTRATTLSEGSSQGRETRSPLTRRPEWSLTRAREIPFGTIQSFQTPDLVLISAATVLLQTIPAMRLQVRLTHRIFR